MDPTQTLVSFIIGAILGALALFLLSRGQLNDLKARITALESDLNAERENLTAARVELASTKERADRANALEIDNARLNEEIRDAVSSAAANEAKLQELIANRGEFENKISQTVESLSVAALAQNNQRFLELANEKLKDFGTLQNTELEKRKTAIETLVDPLTKNLDEMKKKVEEIENKREGAYQGLFEQVRALNEANERLNKQTGSLASALKSTPQRGRWGELQLKLMLESVGMMEGRDFSLQESVESEEGRQRPDVIVKLPGGKNFVIDSKVPDSGYFEAHECDDDDTRSVHFGAFARSLKGHIVSLSRKAYWEQFESPDFVVLYLPSDNYLSVAERYESGITEYAFQNKIVLATPSSLFTTLRAAAYMLKQEQLAREAKQIADQGEKLHKGISTFLEHLHKVGRNLKSAQDAYESANGSLNRTVLPVAKKLEALGAKSKKELIVNDDHVLVEIAEPESLADELPMPEGGGLFADGLTETSEA